LIPFGELRPDQPEWDNPMAARVAHNVLPDGDAYGPHKGLTAYSDALPAQPRGACALILNDGSQAIIVGTADNLYHGVGTSFTEKSLLTDGYSVPDDDFWSMQVFGENVVAASLGDAPQVIDLSGASDFANLGGSPPTAKFVWEAAGFLFLGHISGNPSRLQHSDIELIDKWSGGLSSRQDFPTGGHITGGIGDKLGCWVFFDRAVRRMPFSGSKPAFSVVDVAEGIGCIAPHSVCRIERETFWLAEDGFYAVDLNGTIRAIGDKRVNNLVLDALGGDNVKRVQGTADTLGKRIYWHGNTTGTASYSKNYCLVYSLAEDRFTTVDVEGSWLFSASTAGVTLEEVDTSLGYDDIDEIPFSLDSAFLRAGRPAFAALDADHKVAFFTGANLQATVETGLGQLEGEGLRQYVRGWRPLIGTRSALGQIGVCELPGESLTWSGLSSQNVTGNIPFHASGRFARARLVIPAGTEWTQALGIEDLQTRPAGQR
jgi:hypothetical protein